MDKATSRVLFLIMVGKWFDDIKKGIKTHEYREARAYWNKRFEKHSYTHVVFRRGYVKGAELMTFEIKSINRKQNIPNDLKLADVWDIELGKRVR